jgi:hypothetical protein
MPFILLPLVACARLAAGNLGCALAAGAGLVVYIIITTCLTSGWYINSPGYLNPGGGHSP